MQKDNKRIENFRKILYYKNCINKKERNMTKINLGHVHGGGANAA